MFAGGGNGGVNPNVPAGDSLAPYRATGTAAKRAAVVQTKTADSDSPPIATSRDMESAADSWVRISRELESEGGAPLCALVLTNGHSTCSLAVPSRAATTLPFPSTRTATSRCSDTPTGFSPIARSLWHPTVPAEPNRLRGTSLETAYRSRNSVPKNCCSAALKRSPSSSRRLLTM